MTTLTGGTRKVTHDDILRILGEMSDAKVAAIEATGATLSELEEVSAWIAGEDDVMGELEKPAAGIVGEVYEIVTADEVEEEKDRL